MISAIANSPPAADCRGGNAADASFVTFKIAMRPLTEISVTALRFACLLMFMLLSAAAVDFGVAARGKGDTGERCYFVWERAT